MTRVKICGITRGEDAELAVELGAWALGFILWEGSVRACDPAVAAGIARAHRRRVQTVGVFVNPTLDEVARAADQIGLTHLQLHGEEGPSFCAEVARRTGAKVIKAVRVRALADIQALDRFRNVDLHLLDGPNPGSGEGWDWALTAGRRTNVPVMLSGGLTAENVAEGITAVRPFAVDVASGVEAEPGIKDPAKLEAFLLAANPPREPEPEVEDAPGAEEAAGPDGAPAPDAASAPDIGPAPDAAPAPDVAPAPDAAPAPDIAPAPEAVDAR